MEPTGCSAPRYPRGSPARPTTRDSCVAYDDGCLTSDHQDPDGRPLRPAPQLRLAADPRGAEPAPGRGGDGPFLRAADLVDLRPPVRRRAPGPRDPDGRGHRCRTPGVAQNLHRAGRAAVAARVQHERNTANTRRNRRADDGARTRDLKLGKLALYQLSYVRIGVNATRDVSRERPREDRLKEAPALARNHSLGSTPGRSRPWGSSR